MRVCDKCGKRGVSTVAGARSEVGGVTVHIYEPSRTGHEVEAGTEAYDEKKTSWKPWRFRCDLCDDCSAKLKEALDTAVDGFIRR